MADYADAEPAGLSLLRSLKAYGVEYVFGNFGTDHPAFLEAAADMRARDPDAIPELVICPHETLAMSAAHGYAVATNTPQAVIVHVDVGTQNLGAMVHNAHRGNAPVYVIAGVAPHTHDGQAASRDNRVHYLQDVYDQPGIIRQFSRWTAEYRPPADPDEFVARGLELAATPPEGPVYLTATREALDANVEADLGARDPVGIEPLPADEATVAEVANAVREADAPLVITSKLGLRDPERSVDSLVAFAETAGAGVLEEAPEVLSFPRTHEHHVGFLTQEPLERADLLILADTDVPWLPSATALPEDVPIIHIDADPEKATYPRWDFPLDMRVKADAAATLAAVADRLDPRPSPDVWTDMHREQRERFSTQVDEEASANRLTPAVLADEIDALVDEETIVVSETTTNRITVTQALDIDRPGSHFTSHGSGLGWAPGAGFGVKLAHPEKRVITLVGDGSYVFANPTANAWVQGAFDAPALTVIFNNGGWGAVERATLAVHDDGQAAADGVPGSRFEPRMELGHAAKVVDAHTETVTSLDRVEDALREARDAVDAGTPAVLDVHLEPL